MKTKKILIIPIILTLAWIIRETTSEMPNVPTIGVIIWYIERFFTGILLATLLRKRKINWQLGWLWATIIPLVITTEWIMSKNEFQITQLSPIAVGMLASALSLGKIIKSIGMYILALGFIIGGLIFLGRNSYK